MPNNMLGNRYITWPAALGLVVALSGAVIGVVEVRLRSFEEEVDILRAAVESSRLVAIDAVKELSSLLARVDRCEVDVSNHKVDLKKLSEALHQHDERTIDLFNKRSRP